MWFHSITVENEAHCDFVKLREMLIRTNMEDMREKTHTRHYELYRQKRLEQMGFTDVDSDNKPVSWSKRIFDELSVMCSWEILTDHWSLIKNNLHNISIIWQVSFQQTFETKRSNHLAELQNKEDEMRQMFVLRVKEKESELKENEKDVSTTLNWKHIID